MRHLGRLLVGVTLVVFGAAAAVRADDGEESIPLDKVPKAVVDAVKKRFPKAEMLKEASKEMKDGKTVYEVSVKENGKNIDVTAKPEGELLSIEKEIAAKDLPKAVTESIQKKYAKATYKLAEEYIDVKDGKEKLTYYEVQIETGDKKKVEVEVTPDGTIKREEDKTGKKD